MQSTEASREARRANAARAPAQRQAILDYIRLQGLDGATTDEVEVALGLSHQTASARMRDLKVSEDIESLGEVRKTRTGCRAIVWIVA